MNKFIRNQFELTNNLNLNNIKILFSRLILVSLLYIFPLLISNLYYESDYAMTVSGSAFWNGVGTPFANVLISLLNFQFNSQIMNQAFIIDSGPFLQIVSIFFFVLCITIFCTNIFDNENDKYYTLVAFSILANPFILNGLISRFECLAYLFASGIALIASLSLKSRITNVIVGSILIFTSLGIYQFSINLFISSIFILLLVKFEENPKLSISNFIGNCLKLALGYLSYKVFIFDKIIHFSEYYKPFYKFLDLDQNFLLNVLQRSTIHFKNFCDILSQSSILSTFIICSLLAYAFESIRQSQKKIEITLLFIACLLFIIFSIHGALNFFSTPLILPKCLLGFSIILFLAYYSFLKSFGKWLPITKILILIPTFYLFYMSYNFTAVHKASNTFNIDLGYKIIDKLQHLGANTNSKVYIKSSHITSPVVLNNLAHSDQLLNYIIGEYCTFSNPWISQVFMKYLNWDIEYSDQNNLQEFKGTESQSPYFNIRYNNNDYVITLIQNYKSLNDK